MISIYKTIEDKLVELQNFEIDAWVHLKDPSEEELELVSGELGIELDYLRAATDEEERPRIDLDNSQTLIIVDIPIAETDVDSYTYSTLPLGIIHTQNHIVTVCQDDTTIIEDFAASRVRDFFTFKKTRFILQLLYKNSIKFLQYLRQIDKLSSHVQTEMKKSMQNRELFQMMELEKSLVFFATSLVANEIVMEKLLRNENVKKYPDDTELLEDVIVENKQAIEMCNIYRDILSGTMDAYASIISNNLNIVMKFMAAATIIISVPALVAALWGMNVKVPFEDSGIGFWIVLAIALLFAGVTTWLLWRKKML